MKADHYEGGLNFCLHVWWWLFVPISFVLLCVIELVPELGGEFLHSPSLAWVGVFLYLSLLNTIAWALIMGVLLFRGSVRSSVANRVMFGFASAVCAVVATAWVIRYTMYR